MKRKRKEVQEEVVRARLPGEGEMLAVVEQALGNAWMLVRCSDGSVRKGKVPGRYISRFFVRVGDIVIVKPWQVRKEMVDIIYKYSKAEVNWLRENGYLRWLEEVTEEEL